MGLDRRDRDRRRPCRGRGGVGRGAAWAARVGICTLSDGTVGAHAVQSCDRRDGKGSPRSGDRRARRPDGEGDRRDRDPVQAAQSQPRSGGVVAARPGGQERYSAWVREALSGSPDIDWIFRPGGTDPRRTPTAFAGWSSGRQRVTCRSLVVTTGTFLNGLVHIGPEQRPVGPGRRAALPRSGRIPQELWLQVGPAQDGDAAAAAIGDSIDFSRFEVEHGDDPPVPFSFETDAIDRPQIDCHLLYTNDACTTSCARTSTSRRSSTARSPGSVRATARRSKTRSCGSRIASATRSSSSPKGSTSTRST